LPDVAPGTEALAPTPGQPVHRPQGALRQDDGCVQWRLWAPLAENVRLIVRRDQPSVGARLQTEHSMVAEPYGYHVFRSECAEEGLRYMYQLQDGRQYPDPASRWQPDGVHDPSAVFFPETYVWRDQSWKGIRPEDLVLYELHVGTFTPQGTFDAIIPRLGELKTLGVTAIEIMPVGQFPGDRNWGYDGVYPYAVQNSYGGPRGLQRLVDAAHQQGLAVFLDVVYNHFGPEGNYLAQFGQYSTDRYHTPWGKAVNFDGPHSDAVRRFVIDNARMWVRDFHMDGLRLDAVHAIYDFGARHILAEIQAKVQEEARRRGRPAHVIAETNQNDVRLVDPPERGGHGLDGVWSDDFHHSVRALLTGDREGYYQDYGEPKHLAKALNDVFVYDGCYSPFRRRRHGSPVGNRDRTQFVVCIHNHDQVGNRAQGDRSATTLPPAAQRLACGLLMLSPCIVLLLMGEEYAETRPFPFFCSFGDPQLIDAVRRGRREEFAALQFQWGQQIPDPQDPETFLSAKLAWQWPEGSFQAQMRRLYADLLRARREWPPLRDREHTCARMVPTRAPEARDTAAVMLIQRGGDNGLLACANLTAARQPWAPQDLGSRSLLLSTEERQYGGCRLSTEPITALHPYELVLFGPNGDLRDWGSGI
jgi:maltooligosyltrehalose trehalohydrolase